MDDDYGGFENYHVAVFGEPGTDEPCEWVITGRHVTLRAGGASFGGPIFYGHVRRTGNVWSYQAERANAIFKTLDNTQKAQAFVSGADRGDSGISVGSLDGQQKGMVQDLLRSLLLPFHSFHTDAIQLDLG